MRYITLFAAFLLSMTLWAQAPAVKPAPKPVPAKPADGKPAPAKPEVPMGKPPGRHYPVSKNQQALDVKIHINGLSGGDILLAHYYANQNYVLDTGKVDANGNVHFKADTAAPGGIYLLVRPSRWHFEIILAEEQKFSIDISDTNKIVETIKITGSKENTAFYEHQRFMNEAGKKVEPLHAALAKAKAGGNKDSIALVTKQITAVDSSVRAYKKAHMKKYPDTFMSKVLAFMEEPEAIPLDKCPRKADGTIDSTYNYWNYRRHYWDGMDFTDERLLRTPVYYNKMKFWIDKVIPQHPDTLSAQINWLIDQSYQNDELYHYNVSYLTYYYESSKIMGFDAVFVSIVDNNHAKGKCWWISEETNTKIVNQAKKVKYGLMGNQAVNLYLQDSSGKIVELGKIKADYTIVVFWDPTCGHCKTEIPAIKLYYDSLRAAGVSVEVYAIYSELDYATWRKYIREHKHTWKDVCAKDEQELATAKFYYNAIVTPTLYVLDANKKIIAKKIDDKGLKTVLNRRIEMDRKK
ncbi:MAG TPA: redoxin domain-containing protein [Bacteroidia bacterium]|nr:redoxin domain-containing protein [Bacteroidia bacterium]